MRSWSQKGKGLTGFLGYKAGMGQVLMTEDRNSPQKNQEITRPVTFIETPPIFIYSAIGYVETLDGLKTKSEVAVSNPPKQLQRSMTVAKKPKQTPEDFEKHVADFQEVRVLACSQPWKAGLKQTPDVFELAVVGKDSKEQWDFAKTILGKEVPVSQVFADGEFVDVIAVTKGKGWQGVVKRFGVSLNIRKATKKRRHGGSLGPERQGKVMYTIPRAGQMGFHRRTERNKRILKIAQPAEAEKMTPKGGFTHYGTLANEFLVVDGSIPGPVKRAVRLRRALIEQHILKPDLKKFVV